MLPWPRTLEDVDLWNVEDDNVSTQYWTRYDCLQKPLGLGVRVQIYAAVELWEEQLVDPFGETEELQRERSQSWICSRTEKDFLNQFHRKFVDLGPECQRLWGRLIGMPQAPNILRLIIPESGLVREYGFWREFCVAARRLTGQL